MKKIGLLFGVVLLLLQCTNEKPMPNGYDLLNRDNKSGVEPPITLKATRVAQYWEIEKTTQTGQLSTLLLGNAQDVHSDIVLKCWELARVDTNAVLDSVNLYFYGRYLFAQDSLMDISIHRINTDWQEDGFSWSDLDGGYDQDPLENTEVVFHANGWNKIRITDLQFMKEWIRDTYNDDLTIHGLLVKCDQPDIAAEFVSTEYTDTSLRPYFKIYMKNAEGAQDSIEMNVTHDGSLLQNSVDLDPDVLQESPEFLRVGDVSGFKSLLQFDVSGIPHEATIHKALLTFYIDAEHSKTKQDGAMTVAAARIVSDSTWDPVTIELDSLTSPASDEASVSNETFAFDNATAAHVLSKIVQKWVSDDEAPNNGLILVPNYPGQDFQEIALKTGAGDSIYTPTLEITYSLPPSHRFAE